MKSVFVGVEDCIEVFFLPTILFVNQFLLFWTNCLVLVQMEQLERAFNSAAIFQDKVGFIIFFHDEMPLILSSKLVICFCRFQFKKSLSFLFFQRNITRRQRRWECEDLKTNIRETSLLFYSLSTYSFCLTLFVGLLCESVRRRKNSGGNASEIICLGWNFLNFKVDFKFDISFFHCFFNHYDYQKREIFWTLKFVLCLVIYGVRNDKIWVSWRCSTAFFFVLCSFYHSMMLILII